MGDGIVKKYAVVINGDTEERHLKNAIRSSRVLKKDGYETFIANPDSLIADNYVPSNSNSIRTLISGLREKIDDDDELVVYTTGHGDKRNDVGILCLSDGCGDTELGALLDGLPHGKRTVVMDQCYSGNWGKIFLDDPNTLFISAGQPGDTVCCNLFAPFFWDNDVPDENDDGFVGMRERFAHAMQRGGGINDSHLISSLGYAELGRPPFSPEVKKVTGEELEKSLAGLRPGQYAIVMFSASWCGACKGYLPRFEKMAAEAKGQHLFLVTDDEDVAANYKVGSYPTVMMFNHARDKYLISDRDSLLDEMTQFHAPAIVKMSELIDMYRKNMLPHGQAFFMKFKGAASRLSDAEARTTADLLIRLINRKDETLCKCAFIALGYLANVLNADESNMLSRQIRNVMKKYDDVAAVELREIYSDLFHKLSDEELKAVSEEVRCFIKDHDRNGLGTALMLSLYSDTSRYSDRKQLLADEKIFLRAMQKDNAAMTRQFAIYSYGRAYGDEDNADVSSGIRMLKQMLNESDFDIRVLAAYSLARLNRGLNDEDVNELVKFLDEAIVSSKTQYRHFAVMAYGYLAKRSSPEEAAKLAGRFEAMIQDKNIKISANAILVYKEFLLRAGGTEGMKVVRNAMNSEDEDILMAATWAYADLCERVDDTDLPKDAELLRRFINGGKSHHIREEAIEAYGGLGARLDAAEAKLGAKLLREMAASDPDNMVRKLAVAAYADLIDKLNADELAEGAKMLERLAVDPASNGVRMEASIAYEKVAEELKRRTK